MTELPPHTLQRALRAREAAVRGLGGTSYMAPEPPDPGVIARGKDFAERRAARYTLQAALEAMAENDQAMAGVFHLAKYLLKLAWQTYAEEYPHGFYELHDVFGWFQETWTPVDHVKLWNEHIGIPWDQMLVLATVIPNHSDGTWFGWHPFELGMPVPKNGTPLVYFLYDRRGEVCYTGSTATLRSRLNAHARDGKRFDAWLAVPCRNRQDAYALEEEILKAELPRMNQRRGR